MRHYKKRTIILCLASALTVLGSFSADNYKNDLMSLKINNGSGGYISLTAYTKNTFSGNIRTVKQDENTYDVILPETYGDNVQVPDISNYENIENIQISTFPYTPERKGYTSIKIRTYGNPSLSTNTSLYLEDLSGQTSGNSSNYDYNAPVKTSAPKPQTNYWSDFETTKTKSTTTLNDTTSESNTTGTKTKTVTPQTRPAVQKSTSGKNYTSASKSKKIQDNSASKEPIFVIIAICVVALLVMFIYYLSKDKMASIVGEQLQFDDDTEKKEEKKSKRKRISRTINKLDSIYTNIPSSSSVSKFDNSANTIGGGVSSNEESKDKIAEDNVVIDLDTLYNEKLEEQNRDLQQNLSADEEPQSVNESSNEPEEDDLSEFLDSFSFEDEIKEEPAKEVEEENNFDNELYESTINNDNIVFSQSDENKLTQLIQNEISDDTLDNINDFLPEEDLKPKPLTQEEILENLLAEYTIKQDISFSKDDVDALKKIMSVELDSSFVTDLRTNSEKTIKMKKELEQKATKPHKTSELLTLNVKDLLPDLSIELKKQGNKRVESNAKPEVVYYSEGYEVSKFTVNSELSNIAKALQSKEATQFRPSDDAPIVEDGYDVQTLEIQEELPDFADVKANPEKYENHKEKVVVDENALLQSISNVKFRPFYEDVQDELNKFEGFEIVNNFEDDDIQDDFLSTEKIEDDNYLDLDNFNVKSRVRVKPEQTQKVKDDAQKLLELIEEKQQERKEKEQLELKKQIAKQKEAEIDKKKDDKNSIAKSENNLKTKENKSKLNEKTSENIKESNKKYDENNGNIIKSVKCNDNFTCNLIKDDNGYSVAGEMNGQTKILKHYENLRTENIQARENEKLPDGRLSYIIRVSIHKFIVNVTKDSMEFVMDLC